MVGRSREIDFNHPHPILERPDALEVRRRIVSMTHDEAEKIGIGKSTLHYLRRKAKSDNSFKVYGKVGRKLNDALLHTMSNESFAGNYV